MKTFSRLVISLIFITVAILLNACVAQEVSLPFTTVEKEVGTRAGAQRYEDKQPNLMIVATADEISSLIPYLAPEFRSVLAGTDFDRYFVIAVFQGLKPTYDYEVQIDRVAYSDKNVRIFSQFLEPTKGQMVHPVQSSPYHVVKVEKPHALAGSEVEFTLVVADDKILTVARRLP
jgi:hypothetical protein